jgi:hypothetical protein
MLPVESLGSGLALEEHLNSSWYNPTFAHTHRDGNDIGMFVSFMK